MKTTTSIVAAALLAAASASVPAQQPPKPGCEGPDAGLLDFWIGEWELSYIDEGKKGTSRNRVSKILDGCVVLEEFTGAPGVALDGKSMSMYDKLSKRWKQTWVDNTGSYLDFVGSMDGGDVVFAREAEVRGKKVAQRMVFRDVAANSLKWLWQRSDDGGKTWSTQWEIDYKRVK